MMADDQVAVAFLENALQVTVHKLVTSATKFGLNFQKYNVNHIINGRDPV